jgi:membrane-bound ClpP family serine protease
VSLRAWRDIVSVLLIIIGIIMFLYGANSYNGTLGWTGFGLFFGGFAVYIVLKAYEVVEKRSVQKP